MSVRKQYLFLILGICFGVSLNSHAQTTRQQVYWVRLYLQNKINDRFEWHFEADERRAIRPDRPVQFITHTHLRWNLRKKTALAAGLSYSLINGHFEIRPFQELHLRTPVNPRWEIIHRLRSEQRWFQQAESEQFLLRYRYRYRLQINHKFNQKWVLKLADEWMTHTDAFDQNRIYAGIEFRCPTHFSIETGYLHIVQRRTAAQRLESNILRTTLLFILI